MADAPERTRVGWPVLLALLLALGAAAVLVWQMDSGAPPITGGAEIGAVPELEARSDADTWQHHAWGPDGGRSMRDEREEAPRAPGPATDAVFDPQRRAMERAFPEVADGGLPFAPLTRPARIVAHEGALPTSPDATCAVRLLPARSGRFDCLARVTCGDVVLYPNPSQSAGYNTCELEDGAPARLEDTDPTPVDGDPILTVDLRAGTAAIEERGEGVEAFRVTLRLEASAPAGRRGTAR